MSTKAETRDRLVDVARDLFWRQGYSPTGIAENSQGGRRRQRQLVLFFPDQGRLTAGRAGVVQGEPLDHGNQSRLRAGQRSDGTDLRHPR